MKAVPLAVCNDGKQISLVFATMVEAVEFIAGQANNPQWKCQWRFRFLDNGRGVAETEEAVSIKFQNE